mmetsp:Transcript_28874/g.54605  ORF Transcript_28874/g.54605 Transcript_28874/m.54605 type:complete len:279 (-) Transcript_28874:74-910(-)
MKIEDGGSASNPRIVWGFLRWSRRRALAEGCRPGSFRQRLSGPTRVPSCSSFPFASPPTPAKSPVSNCRARHPRGCHCDSPSSAPSLPPLLRTAPPWSSDSPPRARLSPPPTPTALLPLAAIPPRPRRRDEGAVCSAGGPRSRRRLLCLLCHRRKGDGAAAFAPWRVRPPLPRERWSPPDERRRDRSSFSVRETNDRPRRLPPLRGPRLGSCRGLRGRGRGRRDRGGCESRFDDSPSHPHGPGGLDRDRRCHCHGRCGTNLQEDAVRRGRGTSFACGG